MKRIHKKIEKDFYLSFDNIEFENENECIEYEKRIHSEKYTKACKDVCDLEYIEPTKQQKNELYFYQFDFAYYVNTENDFNSILIFYMHGKIFDSFDYNFDGPGWYLIQIDYYGDLCDILKLDIFKNEYETLLDIFKWKN